MTGPQLALVLTASFAIGLALGHAIGAWPGGVLRERDAARAENTQLRQQAALTAEMYVGAVKQLVDLDGYGPPRSECLCEPDCDGILCPCVCHV